VSLQSSTNVSEERSTSIFRLQAAEGGLDTPSGTLVTKNARRYKRENRNPYFDRRENSNLVSC
jgi:hypothetical protein